MLIRLDKYLADSGYGTRSEVRSLLRSGRVSVDGAVVKDAGRKIDSSSETVSVDGEKVEYSDKEYYMLYKPAGVISATKDKSEKTVVDLIDSKKRRDLFPVGRLDKDTEGLLIITNDGALSHKLLSPNKHVEKRYIAFVSGELREDAERYFSEGIDIGDEEPTKPAGYSEYKDINDTEDSYLISRYRAMSEEYSGLRIIEVRITEGRYHQIKRMFEALGAEVVYLKRYSMGDITLDKNLSPGEYKKIDLK